MYQVIVERGLVTDGTEPLGLLLVHLEVKAGIEALKMVACRGTTW